MDDRRYAGLCASCRHAVRQRNGRGNEFWRCRRADRDPALLRYPPLPRSQCHGFEEGRPEVRDTATPGAPKGAPGEAPPRGDGRTRRG